MTQVASGTVLSSLDLEMIKMKRHSTQGTPNMLTVREIEGRFDRPLWATCLCIADHMARGDTTPYYWADASLLIVKRVTSKRKLNPTIYGVDLRVVKKYDPAKFKLPFFEDLRQANMLED